MAPLKLINVLLLSALLGACGSTPRSNYYMLSADARGNAGDTGPSLGVGPITIPEYLKRREIVINSDAHRLQLADFDRWAEPLDAGVERVVALNLAALMDTQQVQAFPWARNSIPAYAVRIHIAQFAIKGRRGELVAKWTVYKPGEGGHLSQHISTLETTAPNSDPENVATAYSQLLLQLSKDIAAAITDHQSA